MKILMVNALDYRYGAVRRVRAMFEGVKALGHEVVLVESNCEEEGKGVISISQKDSFWGLVWGTLCRCWYCFKLDFDLLLVFKLNPLTIPCILAGMLKGKKVVVDWDDLDSDFQGSFFRKLVTRVGEVIFPPFLERVTTHNEFLANYARRQGAGKVQIVPQTVNLNLFNPANYSREKEKRTLGLEGKTVVAYLATLTEGGAKDLESVIEGFSEALKSRKDLRLLVIGGGPLQDKWRNLIRKMGLSNYIIVTGTVSPNEVPKYLAASDVGVIFMSDTPGNCVRASLKLLEYLAMNLPVAGKLVGYSAQEFGNYPGVFNSSSLAGSIIAALESNFYFSPQQRERFSRNYGEDNLIGALRLVFSGD